MTKKEALQILAILKAAYPASYNGMTQEEASGTVAVWCMQFDEMPGDVVMMAVHKLIATNKFPPTVAEVKEKLKSLHWEAYDMISGHGIGLEMPEAQRTMYKRIYDLTDQYRFGHMYEPKIRQMISSGTQKQLGE